MKTSPERKVWLAGLKVGDVVALPAANGFRDQAVVRRVNQRQIIIRQDGWVVDDPVSRATGHDDYTGTIEPATPEDLETHERYVLVDAIGRATWGDVPTQALRQIVALIKVKA